MRTLVELLRVSGPELGRRWLAALLVVPEREREAVVEAVERRVVEAYRECASERDEDTLLDVAEEPVQREGYVEQVIRTYARRGKARDDEGDGRAEHRSAS